MKTLILLLLSINAYALNLPPTDKEESYFYFKNKTINPGFENGTTNWTSSGGTFSVTTTASDVAEGARSAVWDASAASQTLSGTVYTIERSLRGSNGYAKCSFRTTATDYKIQVHDGTNVLAEQAINSSTEFVERGTNFIFPTSGTARLRVLSASDAAAIYIDDCYIGKASNITTSAVAQSQMIGSAYIAGTSSCSYSRTNTAFGAFGTTAACPGPTVEVNAGPGVIQTTDTDLPRFTVNDLPAGTYEVGIYATFRSDTNSARADLTINDGTTSSGRAQGSAATGGNDLTPGTVIGIFTYTAAGNRTFELYGLSTSGTITVFGDTAYQTRFWIKRFGGAYDATYNANIYPWRVDANISGADIDLGSSNQASYITPNNGGLTLVQNSGSAPVGISCSSTNDNTVGATTCPAGSEEPGIVFNIPQIGDYLACASFTHVSNSGSGLINAAFQVVATGNGSQTITYETNSRINSGNNTASTFNPLRVCGVVNFSSIGKKTIRLMYEQVITATISTNTIRADGSAAVGQRDLHWEVYPVSMGLQMPVFLGSVTSNATGSERIERAYVAASCTGSPCTIGSQSGSWLSSITRTGTGAYSLNFASGMFSAAPTCSILPSTASEIRGSGTPTSSAFTFQTFDSGGSFIDAGFSVLCMGPR